MNAKRAFTLIELLVVITIIVVLLALLAPALDKAIYQAELVQCAGNQKGIASAGIVYAAGNRRRYPTGRIPREGGAQPHLLGSENDPAHDIRPALKEYMPLKMLVDPLAEPVDLSAEANDADTGVFATYEIWMGWQYTGELGGRGMMKIGDRVGWKDDINGDENGHRSLTHDFLVTGLNTVRVNNAGENAHPDSDGVAVARVWHNKDWLLGGSIGITKTTVSFWETGDNGPRGTVDQNYASSDGSVTRHVGITGGWNDVQDEQGTLFFAAPWHASQDVPGNKRFLPAR